MREVLSVAAMRTSDAAAIAGGVSGRTLMGRAAQAVFRSADWTGGAAIVCGSGNNGGDGYALALLLREAGVRCRLYLLGDRFSEDGRWYYDQCLTRGIPYEVCSPDTDLSGWPWIVDCLFGTGFRGRAEGLAAALIEKINAAGARVVSVDIPSGLQGDGGVGEPCVCAEMTVAIGSPQPGLYLGRGKDVCGRLVYADIGIRPVGTPFYLTEAGDFRGVLPPRANASHKGSYGYVALVGGCVRYAGAAKLANLSCAALRSGCGVATLAVPASIAPAVSPWLLESTLAPLPDRDGYMRFDPAALDGVLGRTKAAALGMGWGGGPDNAAILRHVLATYRGRLVLDADGLNTLAAMGDAPLRGTGASVVLTPHIREFSRLSGWPEAEILADPVGKARVYAAQNGCIVLLKGPATVVTDGETVLLTDRGSPGMATAGSGDVLTGVLAGLLGWADYSPLTVACGAYAAGLAGELAAAEKGALSMLAGDTVDMLPRAFRALTDIT